MKCFSWEPASVPCPSPTLGALGKSGVKQTDLQFKRLLPLISFICNRQIVYHASLYTFEVVIF